jgi:hypothetical protein
MAMAWLAVAALFAARTFSVLAALALADTAAAMAVSAEKLIKPMAHLTHSILLVNYPAFIIAPVGI